MSAARVFAQGNEKPLAEAHIAGTVIDQQGQPLANISVHAVLEQTRMYMPTVNSDEAGQFVIENLEPGIYAIFGESDAAGYPNTALSFYPNENPIKVTLENMGTATVVLVLGPDRARIQLDWVPRVRRRIPSRPAPLHRRPFPL